MTRGGQLLPQVFSDLHIPGNIDRNSLNHCPQLAQLNFSIATDGSDAPLGARQVEIYCEGLEAKAIVFLIA